MTKGEKWLLAIVVAVVLFYLWLRKAQAAAVTNGTDTPLFAAINWLKKELGSGSDNAY